MEDRDDTLTVEEAAKLLKVDPTTVQRELKAQRLPGNKVGRAWRIRREDLRTHLKGRQRDPRRAVEYAHSCLHRGDFKSALVALVAAPGYEDMPAELRFVLTRRTALLIEATEVLDIDEAAELAERTRWHSDGDDPFAITYLPAALGLRPPWTVRLAAAWNGMLDEFLFALRDRPRAVPRSHSGGQG